jgi:hypothetical protein
VTSLQWDLRWHCEIRDLATLPSIRDLQEPPCVTGPFRRASVVAALTGLVPARLPEGEHGRQEPGAGPGVHVGAE